MTYHDPGDETAQLYAAGTLTETQVSAFEQHLLSCAVCRREVQLAGVIRGELSNPAPVRRPRPWMYVTAAGLAAGVLIAITLPDRDAGSGFGDVASAPGYDGVAVRATADAADSAFSAAMALYKKGAFRESVTGFRAAREAGADSVTTTFFLGASLLMSGLAEESAVELGRASRMGRNAYTDESRYYRAKALLRLGREAEALAELQAAGANAGPIQLPARALADSIAGAN